MYSIVTTLPLGALVLHNTSPETQSLSLTYCGLLVRKSRKSSTGQALSPESGSGWSWCGIQIARSCRFFDKSNVYSSDVWHILSLDLFVWYRPQQMSHHCEFHSFSVKIRRGCRLTEKKNKKVQRGTCCTGLYQPNQSNITCVILQLPLQRCGAAPVACL